MNEDIGSRINGMGSKIEALATSMAELKEGLTSLKDATEHNHGMLVKRIDGLDAVMKQGFQQVNREFGKVYARFDVLEARRNRRK